MDNLNNISYEDALFNKPAPDCFIKAMHMTGLLSSQTIIFEDAEVGLAAAKASKANFIKVYGYN